jgi:hypothetical protein
MSKTNEGKVCDAVIRRPRAAGSRRRGERYWNTDFGSWRRTAALRELATVCQLAVVSLAFGTVVSPAAVSSSARTALSTSALSP